MHKTCYCFGEILWDLLPAGKHAGGAPFNVAAHLAQLRVPAAIISTVGLDPLGDEIVAIARAKAVETSFIGRAARGTLTTGTVKVTIDKAGNATYEIVRPVAWDAIEVNDATLRAVADGAAFVYGSLAARSMANLKNLKRLLLTRGPMKLFDVNLRPPHDHLPTVLELVRHADVLKLNHDELLRLASHVGNGKPLDAASDMPDLAAVADACSAISNVAGVRRICVTMAAAGAAFWEAGETLYASAPAVDVRDTVGAGDAFMAVLVIGMVHGARPQAILDAAVRVGAFVASRDGAIPLMPPDLVTECLSGLIRRWTKSNSTR